MHPRWHTDQPGAPLVPKSSGDRSARVPAEGYFNEPLPDLERQLAAELSGAAWTVVAFAPEDGLWCDWVYRNLNGYPLPTSLVDRVTPHGFSRPHCLSVFPDRRDPAYADQYPQALQESVYLIVVCSPDSVRSAAVEEKIRAFKTADGDERIVALVVDGPPNEQPGGDVRAPQCDWLPTWLRLRLEPDGFRSADRSEPRVVDARRGYRSLKQVRDSLLTAVVDMDATEFERLGGCARPVECVLLSQPTLVASAPEMTTAVAIPSSVTTPRRGGSTYTICTAIMLILVAAVFGIRSFLEITADEPTSTLQVGPVTGVLAGHSVKTKTGDDAYASQAPPLTPETSAAPEASVAQSTPPAAAAQPAQPTPAAPVPPAPVPVVSGASVLSAKSNVPQIAPAPVFPTSHIVPTYAAAFESPPVPASVISTASSASSMETDAVLLDEVRTLERHGDETMAEKRTEDALDLYHTALVSAEEFAARKSSGPAARDHVVALERKLATLEVQNSSTAEARTTYLQARKALLQLKSQGQWSRERAKTLDEIESRILSLPRD